jgi:hypothetical protein
VQYEAMSGDLNDLNSDWNETLLLQCQGCGHHSIHAKYTYAQFFDENNNKIVIESIFPRPNKRQIPPTLISMLMQLGPFGSNILSIMFEVNDAITNDSNHLAAMGLRAIIESLMIGLNGKDTGSLSGNLSALFDQGHLSVNQKELLGEIIDFGSAVIHRQFKPNNQEIETSANIIEAILMAILAHPLSAKSITARVPPRSQI